MTVFEVHLGRVVPVSLLSNQSCAPSPHPGNRALDSIRARHVGTLAPPASRHSGSEQGFYYFRDWSEKSLR